MITGVLLGLLIAALVFACLLLLGQNTAYRGQIKSLTLDIATSQMNIRSLAERVQKLNTPIVINIPEAESTRLANILLDKMRQIVDSEQKAELNKLN